jgi:hypothetical protein
VLCNISKTFTLIVVVLLISGFFGTSFELTSYSTSKFWYFQNHSYLDFNPTTNFTDVSHYGAPYDSSLIAYWNMDEVSGSLVNDSSGNGGNGLISQNSSWVAGKFGNALNFANGNLVTVNDSSSLNLNDGFSIGFWLKTSLTPNWLNFLTKMSDSIENFCFFFDPYGNIRIEISDGTNTPAAKSSLVVDEQWHYIMGIRNVEADMLHIYVDGQLVGSAIDTTTGNITCTAKLIFGSVLFNGVVDDVRIYNRTLSGAEIASLFDQSAPLSYADYYRFTDPLSNNTLIMHVENYNANNGNNVLVTCANFFANNKLIFISNNSATINVWTNLGEPTFSNGIWNSQNLTTTLVLDGFSLAEINWNRYKITTYVDDHSSVSSSNVTIPYGNSQTFSFGASQGYSFSVTVDSVSQGQISSYRFSNVTENHVLSVSSKSLSSTNSPTPSPTVSLSPILSLTPNPSQLPGQTNSTNPPQKSQQDTRLFPTQTIAIAAIITGALIALLASTLKKRYLKIEPVDKENFQEASDDYTL